jgi:hypothetical protein
MLLNKLQLIYHPKDKGTFQSARWRKNYTPDLSIVTRASVRDSTLCASTVFPETNIVRSFYTLGIVYHCRHQFQSLVGTCCQLIWNRLFKKSTTLFNSFPPARISTHGFQTPLKLPQNVIWFS